MFFQDVQVKENKHFQSNHDMADSVQAFMHDCITASRMKKIKKSSDQQKIFHGMLSKEKAMNSLDEQRFLTRGMGFCIIYSKQCTLTKDSGNNLTSDSFWFTNTLKFLKAKQPSEPCNIARYFKK